MLKFLYFFAIFGISFSTPVTDESIQETTQFFIEADETLHIHTDPLYKISFLVATEWSDDFLNKNSAIFKQLRDDLDVELREIVKENSKVDLHVGKFRLVSVWPSNEVNFVYVILVVEAESEKIINEWIDAIEPQIIINNKLKIKEIGAKLTNGDLNLVKVESGENFECDNEFCLSEPLTEATILNNSSTPLPELPSPTCSPHEQIKRGQTSIFIFEDQNCVEHIKSQFSPTKTAGNSCLKSKEKEFEEDDPMTPQTREKRQHLVEEDESEVEQTVVVVKKRGNKVFIEI